jgi:hypothetical protein
MTADAVQMADGDRECANKIIFGVRLLDINSIDPRDKSAELVAQYRTEILSAHHDDLLDRCENMTHDLADAGLHQRLTEGKLSKAVEALRAAKEAIEPACAFAAINEHNPLVSKCEKALTLISKVLP